MSKRVDGSLGTLLQGISQQPDKQRLPGQVQDQLNMTSDPLRMLHRRPPTQFKRKVSAPTVDPSKIFVHFYSRGDTEEYQILVYPNDGTPVVFDTQGQEYTVEVSAAMQTYLNTADPKKNLGATTVGDYTFFINKAVTVTGTSTGADTWPLDQPSRVALVAEQYSRTYTVRVLAETTAGTKDATASTTSPESTDTNAELNVSANALVSNLAGTLNGNANFSSYFDTEVQGNELVILPKSNVVKYTVEVSDTTGGDALVVSISNEVTALSKLPAREKAGAIYRIIGGTDDADDFYMEFSVNEEATSGDLYFQSGIWIESQFGTAVFDQDTMPHLLIRGENFDFIGGSGGETVDTVLIDKWADRAAGDTDSNKFPDFVTAQIVDIAVFQDRLVLVYPEGISMSVTRDYFNFFKKTVSTLLPDAPIGLASAGVRVNLLRFAQIQDRALILFADQAQYTVPGNIAITPTNATMTETTQFVMQTEVRPAASGQNLFFAVNSGVFSGVREFYTDSDLNSNNARPITIAVDKLIKGTIRLMESSTNISKMICMGSSGSEAYIYEYLWEDNERLQSAWSRWEFNPDRYIFHVHFTQEKLSVLSYDASTSEVHVALMDISQDTTQEFFEGDILMDHRTILEDVETSVSGLDHLSSEVTDLIAVQGPGCPQPGMPARIASWDGDTVAFSINYSGGTVYIGEKFVSSVTPTRVFVRDADNQAITTSQLTIGSMYINFIDAGDFNVDVIADYSYTARNAGRILGRVSSTIGDFKLTSGSFEVPVRAKTDRSRINIRTDSAYPFTVSDIEWDGQFYKRGKRITRPGG